MKKYLLGILIIMTLFCNNVYALENEDIEEDKKVKVYMFSMGNDYSKGTEKAIDEIKKYKGYGTKFELIVLESCIYEGEGKGKDSFSENQDIFDRLIEQYNAVYDARYLSHQYPTFLVGRNIEIGTVNLQKTIKKNIKDENYNNDIYECIVENKESNCFEKASSIKVDNNKEKEKHPQPLGKTLILVGGLLIVSFFMFGFIYLLN